MKKNDILYKMDDRYFFTNCNGDLILVDLKSNLEVEISIMLHEILSLFFVARSIESAFWVLEKKTKIYYNDFVEIVDDLIEQKLIKQYRPGQVIKTRNLGGMFNSDISDVSEVLKNEYYDVIFIGFPYDLSASFKSGSRFAPNYLRGESKAIFQYAESNQFAPGMWDSIEKRYVLKNVKMADCGDIHSPVYQRNGKEFDYLENTVRRLVSRGAFPVIMGGDHSISLSTIRGAAAVNDKMGVIQFDAHDDYGGKPCDYDWRINCHHGNFVSWLAHDKRIEIIAQLGIRQLCSSRIDNEKIFKWSYRNVDKIVEDLYARLSVNVPYYITFDVDCMSPSVINSTGTPLPGGFSLEDILYIIDAICRKYNVIGLDVVELIPGVNNEGIIINQIILSILDKVFKNRKGSSENE